MLKFTWQFPLPLIHVTTAARLSLGFKIPRVQGFHKRPSSHITQQAPESLKATDLRISPCKKTVCHHISHKKDPTPLKSTHQKPHSLNISCNKMDTKGWGSISRKGAEGFTSFSAEQWDNPGHCKFSQDPVFFIRTLFLESHDYIRIHTSLFFFVKKKYLQMSKVEEV